MNYELKCLVKETSDELSYRKKYYPNAKSIKNDDLLCTICDDTLTKKSFNIHPILGILLCKNCFEKSKSADNKKCIACNEGKKLIECKSKKCIYVTCEECMTKINPKAKSYYKQGKWNCFACHISPLYKLRGVSAAVAAMSSNSIEKSSNQPNKRIVNRDKDKSNEEEEMYKTNGQRLLSRSDSTSSSGTEFTKKKIIETNLSSSSRIVDHHHHHHHHHHHRNDNVSDGSEINEEDSTLTNRQLLDFKHNVKKLFDGLKEMGNKLLNDVEKAQQNFYTNKNKFKSSDVTDMMSECKNIIQHVQDSTDKHEKKLIERHKTWCRKSKIKNTFVANNNVKLINKHQQQQQESIVKNKHSKRVDLLSDEQDFEKRASTPINTTTTTTIDNNNSQLQVSDCDEQVFSSGNEDNSVNKDDSITINNTTDHNNVINDDENSLDISKDISFSDVDDVQQQQVNENNFEESPSELQERQRQIQSSSKSSKKSSDESDNDNDKRKKRFFKVRKVSEKIDSDESTDSTTEKVKPKRRLSKTKIDKTKNILFKSNQDIVAIKEKEAKAQLLNSSSSDNNEKNKNDSDIVLTPESQFKTLTYDAETDNENENYIKKNNNKHSKNSSDSQSTEIDDDPTITTTTTTTTPLVTKGSKKQQVNNLSSDNKTKTDVNNDKVDVDSDSTDSTDFNKVQKVQKDKEEQAKKALLNTSSDSDNQQDKINQATSETDDDDDDDNNKKKINEDAKKAILDYFSSSDNEENLIKKKDEEAKKALLNISSESDDDKIDNKKNSNSNNNNNNNSVVSAILQSSDSSDNETLSSKISSSRFKSKKLQLKNNIHYNKDKKLKLKCTVELNQLSKKVLAKHSKALLLSTEYLENKKVLSLMSLDRLEKKSKKKKHRSDSSADDDTESTNSRSKKKAKIADKDTLLDHLKKVETGNENNDSNNSDTDKSDSCCRRNKGAVIKETEEPNLIKEADKFAKASILASSDSSDDVEETTSIEANNVNSPIKENDDKNNKKLIKKNRNKNNDNILNKDEDEDKKKKSDDNWKRSKLLTSKFLDSDSEEENAKAQRRLSQRSKNGGDDDDNNESDSNKDDGDDSFNIKKKVNRARRRRLDSDSDVKISDDDLKSDSDDNNKNEDDSIKNTNNKNLKRKKRSDSSDSSLSLVSSSKKSKTKRRRIRAVANDSDDSSNDDNDDDDDDLQNSQGGANKSGRKNIRKVLKDKHVADGTLQAAKQEEERIKRMAERQKLYNEMYEARLASEAKVDKLVLDFDAETKQVLLEVDENLVKRLKPHQAKGIKFMWDACFESLERIKESEGSGCILAHCMGLGKSFQVVTLAHTLLTHSEKTGINTILIVVPLSTVLNWMNEFKQWLSNVDNDSNNDIELYEMTKAKTNLERKCHLENWQRTGGVLIIGYEMFRNLCAIKGKVRKSVQEAILKCIIDPGPDLIICDEGHLLKNEDSAISKAIRRVKTLRRVVLTGTPLQNNLIEYHCMVQFVKPNLLGTKKEFSNRFANPIQNGQFDDSTEYDVKLMKKRAHVLHKMLEGSVQRFDYSVLTPFLPPKQEYVISIRLTQVQAQLYQYYIDNFARKHKGVGGSLFADFQALSRLWTHPFVVKLHTENNERIQQKKRDLEESDSEGSLKDFIDDGSDEESDSSSSSSSSNNNNHNNSSNEGSDVIPLDDDDDDDDDKQQQQQGSNKKNNKKNKSLPPPKRGTRANPVIEDLIPESEDAAATAVDNKEWWTEFIKDKDFDDMRLSAKLIILFDIIKEAEAIGDKVLVFSQSLYSLTLIEKFLGMIDDETQNGNELDNLGKHTGCWAIGQDYFRFDGQTSAENRSHWVKSFNKPSNTRARLFLISTRAGGLGINLTAANRVVIFDASWNPSHDVQSIFRIYRFGQKKPCYVYRLLAAGTMEEKIYNRQVTKLSLSCRVVDELQIERHYSNNDLAELYKFDPPNSTIPDLALPKDRLLAEIFLRHKNLVETFHEHDSLLENIAEEELDAEERKQAWQEYEDEKAGKRMIPPPQMIQQQINYPNHQHMVMMQQYNNQIVNSLNLNNPIKQVELSQLMSMFQQDYPYLSEQAQHNMAVKALSNMYNYVENQVVGRGSSNYNSSSSSSSVINNPTGSNISNPTATLANALAQQEYTRLHSTSNNYNQQQQLQKNLTQQQRQIMYSQSFGNSFGKSQQNSTAAATSASKQQQQQQQQQQPQFVVNDDSDDIIEIPTTSSSSSNSSSNNTRVNQTSNSPKRQEE